MKRKEEEGKGRKEGRKKGRKEGRKERRKVGRKSHCVSVRLCVGQELNNSDEASLQELGV